MVVVSYLSNRVVWSVRKINSNYMVVNHLLQLE